MTETDVLGSPYTRETLSLADDYEGAVVCTLVQRAADRSPSRGAVLHVHGFCDYFFQTATAEFFTALGYDFFALDLRKHGRSLLPHQTPNFCLDLAEYHEDLDAALSTIRERTSHQRVVISAHSTGGLVTPLWTAERASTGDLVADALVLNSPWLDLQGSFFVRTAGTEAINRLGLRRPYATVPRTLSGVYGESLHRDHHGEWDFDVAWKPLLSLPVKAGWLRAIRAGHRSVHKGVAVPAPVLVLCSRGSLVPETYTEEAQGVDTVLDVRQIARWSHQLGDNVTLVRVPGAVHDVFLSRKEVREDAFDRTARWLTYALEAD
ncbi:MAG: alpha/beta hydrolase [Nocardioidaceae bacterium]